MNSDHIVRIVSRWLSPRDRANLAMTCATMYNLPALFSTRANIESRAHHARMRDLFMSCARCVHADDPEMCTATQRLFPLFMFDASRSDTAVYDASHPGTAIFDDPAFSASIARTLSCTRCIEHIARACTRGYLDYPLEQDIIAHPHCLSCAVVIARRDNEVILGIPHARELCAIFAFCGCCIRSFLMRADPCTITPRVIDVSMAIIARNASDDDIVECMRNVNASSMSAETIQNVRRVLFMQLAMRGRHEVIEKIVHTVTTLLG